MLRGVPTLAETKPEAMVQRSIALNTEHYIVTGRPMVFDAGAANPFDTALFLSMDAAT